MPGAVRSFTGHFAPHVALILFLMALISLVPTFFTVGVQPGVAVPTWTAAIIITVVTTATWAIYMVLRHYHDRHQCTRCDRIGARDRLRPRPVGLLAWHWHWCRTAPGIWIYLAAWFVAVSVSVVSSIGTVLIYAGMALWTASTIAHQARMRSCPAHTAVILYDPSQQWFRAERLLTELHYRARGAEYLRLHCELHACDGEVTVESPEAAVIWTLAHSDMHLFGPTSEPFVLLRVTLDPHLELETIKA